MKLYRLICLMLCLCLAMTMIPARASAAESATTANYADLAAAVEAQVKAFVSSINQPDADDEAAVKLASHGMTKGGATLNAGKSHPLTATLFNSEVVQEMLIKGCTGAIQTMQQRNLQSLPYLYGGLNWYGPSDSRCSLTIYTSSDHTYENREWGLVMAKEYSGKRNGYDGSLDWMVGNANVNVSIEKVRTTADKMVYKVTCVIGDRFDFSTANGDVFKKLISGFGAILFREFNWISTVSFELTVPYSCNHSTGVYSWTYNAENLTMTSDGQNVNPAVCKPYQASEKTYYYYELEDTVRLWHDKPWVMEYDIKKAGSFALAPAPYASIVTPCLFNNGRKMLVMHEMDRLTVSEDVIKAYGLSGKSQSIRHYYGTALSELFKYKSNKTYTFRLENEVNGSGNMIYLTVTDKETGEVMLDRIPMDDYYRYESWTKETVLHSTANSWVSGKDLFISYIGNNTYRFSADEFQLRIWENGDGGAAGSYNKKVKVTAPTCSSQGYTTYICSACGYTSNADYTAPSAHSWGPWEVVQEAAVARPGVQQRSCTGCGAVEQAEIPGLEAVCGDLNRDSVINTLDLILLRQHLAGWGVDVEAKGADVDCSGTVNALDLILLRQYLAGWDVTLGQNIQ